MHPAERQVLEAIVNEARKTSDGFLFAATIPASGDERKRVCDSLQKQGYISLIVLIGRDMLQCQVNEKAYLALETT